MTVKKKKKTRRNSASKCNREKSQLWLTAKKIIETLLQAIAKNQSIIEENVHEEGKAKKYIYLN